MEITIWGDSITYGAGDKEGLGWVGRLRNDLESKDKDAEVYNRGVCGHTTEDVLKRFLVEAESIKPNRIIFALGANDCKIPQGETANKVSLDKYKANIIELVNHARQFTKDIFIVGITCVDEPALNTKAKFSNEAIKQYNEALKEICQNENLVFLDVFGLLSPTDFSDGLHPNEKGYQKMSEEINKIINK